MCIVKRTTGTMDCTHVIFDMDGLLLNTEEFYTIAQQEIAAMYGKEFTWALKAKMMGRQALPAARIFVDELDIPMTPEELLLKREERLDELFPTCALMPGAERLLLHLKDHGVPFSLATSSHTRHYNLKTEKHREMFNLFDHVTTGDQVREGKPSPEIFLHARGRWNPAPHPSNCVVFEDAPAGVEAAKAAGMKCVMVPLRGSGITGGNADAVLESLEDFVPEKFGLPPFRDS